MVPSLLSRWRSEPGVYNSIIEWRSIPARPASFKPFPEDLHPALLHSLTMRSISALYTHQADAWDAAQNGRHLVVVTSTASGKTLCYNLPVLDRLLRNPQARALYLFPTKALAQDQLSGINELIRDQPEGSIAPAVYDGDTPTASRPPIRKSSRLVISNPDMLHTGILPHHTNWAEFMRSLQFVVIDEMHTYRGVFGSHVANVLRRLRRVASHYGAHPQFILTSATIANPAQLAEWLVEAPVTLIDQDGSARGPRHFLIYNPPLTDRQLGIRRSVLQETVRLASDLLAYQVQTIIFGRTRRSVEVILRYLREEGPRENETHGHRDAQTPAPPAPAASPIRGYRSGYLKAERREIEQGLRSGQVRAVAATTALELGIDIGGMGAALLAGYPGTISGTWQQAGRAGRGSDVSLAVLLTSASPLDQFLAQHPDYFFGRSPEQALVNPDNLLILLDHLRCAAFELPFNDGDVFGSVTPERVREFLEFLRQEGVLHLSGGRYFWMTDRYPAEGVSLRSSSAQVVSLQAPRDGEWSTIGEVDAPSANWMVHPGAIYIHEAQTYLVETLDLEQSIAHLKPTSADYYTEPRTDITVSLEDKKAESPIQGGLKAQGELRVTMQVTGYRQIRWYTHETVGNGEVSLPPTELQTTGYWLALAEGTVERLREEGMWTNDPNDYGPRWNALREQVRARDGYRCQVCGVLEGDVAHHVHHKTPFRSFASAEQANQLTNLITLCPSCHKLAETAVRIRSGLAGLSFVLGNLAPLFLMCDPRDLGVHSDPQSPLSEGRPTVVIYDMVPAGIGFSERLYEIHDDLVARATELVSACPCVDGCPSCVGPGGENGYGGKQETLALLKLLNQD